jgi:predicted acyltransferase
MKREASQRLPEPRPPQPAASGSQASGRVVSVDALRGFDMFWIAGGREAVLASVTLIANPVPKWVSYNLSHPAWIGFSAWDLIMPLFLFIVGVAMPFSFGKQVAEGRTKGQLYRKILRRTVLLFFLGIVAQGHLLDFKLDTLHLYCNTLQAIACGYLIGSLLLLELPRIGQILVTVGLLVAYWALLALVPYPGGEAGMLKPENNLALYIDRLLLGRFEDKSTYTWILSGLGFAATTMLGVFGGQLLRSKASPWMKVFWLILLGALCLVLGGIWGFWLPSIAAESSPLVQHLSLPIIKHLWTSSLVLWAGGWSFLLLALFYALIDGIGWRRWAYPLVVLGANAITVYMAWHLIDFRDISNPIVGGLAEQLGPYGEVLKSLGALAAVWLIAWAMYRKRIFIRI